MFGFAEKYCNPVTSDRAQPSMSGAEDKKVEKEKSIPKDAQVMISILKDMGINEFEPRVVNQMLEFSYRYNFEH